MTERVDPSEIERIVGVPRDVHHHWGRVDSASQVVSILHSAECLAATPDLRDCIFSQALDRGIELRWWERYLDQPIQLGIHRGRLVPVFSVGVYDPRPDYLASVVQRASAQINEQTEQFIRRYLSVDTNEQAIEVLGRLREQGLDLRLEYDPPTLSGGQWSHPPAPEDYRVSLEQTVCIRLVRRDDFPRI